MARYRQADVPLHGTTARYKKGKAAARQQQDKVDQFCEFQVNIYINYYNLTHQSQRAKGEKLPYSTECVGRFSVFQV